jgi:hypothetical protein
MKSAVISSAVLSLILGIALPANAQQDEKNEKQDQHRQQQENKKQDRRDQQPQNQDRVRQDNQDRDRQQHQARQQQRSDRGRQQEQHIQQMQNQDTQQRQAQQQQNRQDQSRQQQRDQQRQYANRQQHDAGRHQSPDRNPDQQRVWQSTWQEHRARNWRSDHRSWYSGYRIPQDRYRGYFGPQHWFRISGLPFGEYGGFPRFQYEGYWVTLQDPWPENWSNNWYDNDDVFIDYRNDGYYMYNRRHPDVAIAISISM